MSSGDSISLGQKQLIVFIRAVLRRPDLLILDEATANIDTVTEQLLEDILKKLPKETTKVIIAHRLNTIENADEIFFVNAGTIVRAGSMEHAVKCCWKGRGRAKAENTKFLPITKNGSAMFGAGSISFSYFNRFLTSPTYNDVNIFILHLFF